MINFEDLENYHVFICDFNKEEVSRLGLFPNINFNSIKKENISFPDETSKRKVLSYYELEINGDIEWLKFNPKPKITQTKPNFVTRCKNIYGICSITNKDKNKIYVENLESFKEWYLKLKNSL